MDLGHKSLVLSESEVACFFSARGEPERTLTRGLARGPWAAVGADTDSGLDPASSSWPALGAVWGVPQALAPSGSSPFKFEVQPHGFWGGGLWVSWRLLCLSEHLLPPPGPALVTVGCMVTVYLPVAAFFYSSGLPGWLASQVLSAAQSPTRASSLGPLRVPGGGLWDPRPGGSGVGVGQLGGGSGLLCPSLPLGL